MRVPRIQHFVLAPTYFPRESIIGTTGLNFGVRNENRCDPCVEAPKQNVGFYILLHTERWGRHFVDLRYVNGL